MIQFMLHCRESVYVIPFLLKVMHPTSNVREMNFDREQIVVIESEGFGVITAKPELISHLVAQCAIL